ncbi:MAG: hypothetical protein GY953_22490, partial [bacterium]|nr:hypothetical protein [bacterium]
MLRDLRHAWRIWRRSPLLAAGIVLTFGVAIGANTAVFSVLQAVMLDPLPYPDADRLAILWTDDQKRDVHTEGVSYPNYADWRRMNRSFEDLAFFFRTSFTQTNLTGGEVPERVQTAFVTANFLEVVGVPPRAGRNFVEDDLTARRDVVILSHRLWQRRGGVVG